MFFKGKVAFMDPYDYETHDFHLLMSAEDFSDAMDKLVGHYGNEMVGAELYHISEYNIIDTEDKEFYDYMIKKLEEECIW